jgi:hypothetical protein
MAQQHLQLLILQQHQQMAAVAAVQIARLL